MVCFVPSVMEDDYEKLRKGEIPDRFNKWYFIEAVNCFFLLHGRT